MSASPTRHFERALAILGLAVLIWLIFGRETIGLQSKSFTFFRGMFGIGRSRTFSISDVLDMRVGTFLDPRAGGKWNPSLVRSNICFEYRGKTQRFGNELGRIEAERILRIIREYHPQIVHKSIEASPSDR